MTEGRRSAAVMALGVILESVPDVVDSTPGSEEELHADASPSMQTPRSEQAKKARSVRDRYEGSSVQEFVRTISKVDFGNEIILFGSAILLSVVPIIILLSSLASTRIDDDVARNMGLDRRGAQYIARLFTAPRSGTGTEIAIGFGVAVGGARRV